MEYLKNKEDYKQTLKEWVRTLCIGGLIAITLPNRRFFLHDNDNPDHKSYDLAPSEMNEKEFKDILDNLDNVEILRYNTNQNNFDINALIRKRCASNE